MREREWEKALPRFLTARLGELPPGQWEILEELRLREGFPLAAGAGGREWTLPAWENHIVTEEDLLRVLETAGQGSLHAVLDQLRAGYVTVPGGLRLGICGEGALEEGRLKSFRRVTSLALRFPRAMTGLAEPLLPRLARSGRVASTLILSPPGLGKTTLLRDLIRCLSVGAGVPPCRVGVADERGELGGGALRRFLGPRADVMEHCPKALALTMLLRGMAPEVLAADEITAPGDIAALSEAAFCGTALLATAHGGSLGDLKRRPLYRTLLEEGIFEKFVCISLQGGKRTYHVFDREEAL